MPRVQASLTLFYTCAILVMIKVSDAWVDGLAFVPHAERTRCVGARPAAWPAEHHLRSLLA